ncbi:hypothetical protein V6N11_070377 [Hibiscus sabdariffa]|uniref:MATH domain-containing protein n=1 Tax=Hibiscus sabdariffa TaxID=183260 RepID=A0ABR2QET9_9ROSI
MPSSLNSGSNLTNVKWRVEILKAVDDTKSQSMNVDGEITKVTWRIENFSSFKKDEELRSKDFVVDGNKWRLCIFPKGDNEDFLTIYLEIGDSVALPSGWSRVVQYGFAVVDQIDRMNSIIQVNDAVFNAEFASWGTGSFLCLRKLQDPKRGYLVDDACLVEGFVYTVRTEGLISCEFILETDSDKHKTKEADCDKLALDNQTTAETETVGIPTPSPTQPSCQIEAVEPGEPTEEDIKTFFTSLESELSSSHTVFSKEEAKEALAKLDEALNMTLANFFHSGTFSSLKQAFRILASFVGSSSTLTIEQKNELLAIGECLKELADRAAKAVQDKARLTEMESIKRKITRNLDSNLIRYKEAESEVKWVEQKHAALLAEQKETFRCSKKMKMELEAVGKGMDRV